MENEFGLDLREIRHVIDTAEVLVVRFAILEKRLLIDTRTNAIDGPMVRIVPSVESVEARLEELKQLRPRFPAPDRIMTFWWPRHIGSLETSGVWSYISERLVSIGDSRAIEDARRIYRELLAEERREMLRAIQGEGYQTLWEATA